MHRLLDRITVRLGVVLITGTAAAQDTAIRGYDSVVVTTVIDHRFDPVFPDGSCKEGRDVTGQACLSSTEARDLQRRLRDPASYGATQAVTPVNELELLYYRLDPRLREAKQQVRRSRREKAAASTAAADLPAGVPPREQPE